MMAREDIDSLYFDCYRYQFEDMPDYNMIKAKEFAEKVSGTCSEKYFAGDRRTAYAKMTGMK